jgi:hypothetical protein
MYSYSPPSPHPHPPLLCAVLEVYYLNPAYTVYVCNVVHGTQLYMYKLLTNTWPMVIIGMPPSIKISCTLPTPYTSAFP